MNRRQKILATSTLMVGALGIGSFLLKGPSAPQLETQAVQEENISSQAAIDPATSSEPATPVARAPSSASESENLKDMSQTLFQFTRPESRLQDLVEYLKKTQQDPLVVTQSNPATGEMAIVRTKNPLPGTRYFHAQYMTDENGKGFVQHMSFEFKPGPNALAEAQAAIQSSFPNLGTPHVQKGDFVRWNLDDTYIVWVKKMGPNDLQDDPFNAYTSEDVGTIRAAIEVEIHGDEEHQHH